MRGELLDGVLDGVPFADVGFLGQHVEVDAEFVEVALYLRQLGLDSVFDEEVVGLLVVGQ